MHTGHYGRDGTEQKDHIQAQVDMIEQLIALGPVTAAENILDVGCGIGGSSRHLAKKFCATVTGITLSPKQVARATELAAAEGMGDRVLFALEDALLLPYADESFELVSDGVPGDGVSVNGRPVMAFLSPPPACPTPDKHTHTPDDSPMGLSSISMNPMPLY